MSIGRWPATSGGGTPGGSSGQLQYNNAGALGGVSGATWNGTRVKIPSLEGITLASGGSPYTLLESDNVVYVDGTKTVTFPTITSALSGKCYTIINGDGSGSTTVTFAASGGATIAGDFSGLSTRPYDGCKFMADYTNNVWRPVPSMPSDLYIGNSVVSAYSGGVLYTEGGGSYLASSNELVFDGQALSCPAGILANPGIRFSSSSGMMEDSTNTISLIANSLRTATYTDTYLSIFPDATYPVSINSTGSITLDGSEGTAGQVPISAGAGSAVTWGNPSVGGISIGSSVSSATNHELLYVNGSGNLDQIASYSNGTNLNIGTVNSPTRQLSLDVASGNAYFSFNQAGTEVSAIGSEPGSKPFLVYDSTLSLNTLYQDTSGNLVNAKNLYSNGMVRVSGYNLPASGAGMECLFTSGVAQINVYDRDNSTSLPFYIDCSTLYLNTVVGGAVSAGGDLSVAGTVSAPQLTATASITFPGFYASGSGISFFGKVPQQTQLNTAITPASFVANTSAIADDSATWDGYTIGAVVAAMRAYGLLA